MALNLFKRKQKEKPPARLDFAQAKSGGRAKDVKPLAVNEKVSEEKKEVVAARKKTKNKNSLPGILLHPHVSEKASVLAEKGSYVFRVHLGATKGAIRQSVESLYAVSVQHVRLTKKPPRKIRVGKKKGIQPGLKKAIVTVKKRGNH